MLWYKHFCDIQFQSKKLKFAFNRKVDWDKTFMNIYVDL